MAIECDVLVVGAGPAGSSAAIAAARCGAEVILLERKQQVGVSVSSAGAIGTFLLPLLPFTIPKEFLLWKTKEVVFSFNDVTVSRRGSLWSSYTIDRGRFDSWLVEKAVKAGADLHLETELVDLEVDEDFKPKRAVAKKKTGEEVIEPSVVIAADGADSTVARKIGERKDDFMIGNGLVYELQDIELKKADAAQIFFGNFIPGGYAYIFPTSKNSANSGVGSILKEVNLEQSFQEFCELPAVKGQLRNMKIKGKKRGVVPFSHPVDKMRYGNVLFAGDAAGQNMKPFVEGVLPAVICGSIAGETAAEHVKGSRLERYEENLQRNVGLLFDATDKYVEVLKELSRSKEEQSYLAMLGLSSRVFSLDDFPKLKKEEYSKIKREINDWNGSRARQLKTTLEEMIWASSLRLSRFKSLFNQ